MGKLTRNARMQPCTLRLPRCNGDTATTVGCHLPSVSKGTGIKSEDWWLVFACSSCHDIIDGRTPHTIPQDVILDRMLKGLHETLRLQFQAGLLLID